MLSFKSAVLALSLSLCDASESLRATSPRRLSFELIANYEPYSLVTGHNAIDLDQATMEQELANENFEAARYLYEDGGHSKPFAELTLKTALTKQVKQDTAVTGLDVSNMEVKGKFLETYPAGATVVHVQYHESEIQASYSNCQVGALTFISKANRRGCFADSQGKINIHGVGSFNYTYNQHVDNKAARTLRGFSTGAKYEMLQCENCPYRTFDKFYRYYGVPDYGDKFVIAAFDGTATSFQNGNNDFSGLANASRAEAITKGTAFMNVWMYVIRMMEDALDSCRQGNSTDNYGDAHAWDEAVAFFTGSLEGSSGEGDGKFIYSLINRRCVDFRTCGDEGNENTGDALLNHQLRRLFKRGQEHLLKGKCAEARQDKEQIENLMAVPLVQGALRYAYILGTSSTADEKGLVEGATFAAAVLPIVHECNPRSAEAIYENLRIGAMSTELSLVKNAFEENYACMGITCADVGGYYDDANSDYYVGAGPCSGTGSSSNSDMNALGIAVSVTVGVVLVLLAAMFVALKRRKSVESPPKNNPMFIITPPPDHWEMHTGVAPAAPVTPEAAVIT